MTGFKKVVIGVTAAVILAGGAFFWFQPQRAQATFPTFDASNFVQWIKEFLNEQRKESFATIVGNTFTKVVQRYLDRIAYETADFLATGGPGGGSLNRRESFDRILRTTGEAALGEFLQDLSAVDNGEGSLNSLGLNLCNPTASLKLGLSLQLLDAKEPPELKSACDINQIKNNWKRVAQSAGTVQVDVTRGQGDFDLFSGNVGGLSLNTPWGALTQGQSIGDNLITFNQLFSPQASDLGIISALQRRQIEIEQSKIEAIKLATESCPDVKDFAASIDDEIVPVNCEELRRLKEEAETGDAAKEDAQTVASPGVLGILANAGKIFANTLVSGLLKKYIQSGVFSLADLGSSTNLSEVRSNIIDQLRGGGISPFDLISGQQVANSLNQLQRPSLSTVEQFDYLSEFTICPNNRNNVSQLNCSIDDNFAAAVRERQTVQQALDQGRIRGDLPLISNLNVGLNSDPFCVRNGYCHSNIVRLRKYRILPIGWEIAASLSPIDKPVTLQEVIDCFDNSGRCKFRAEENIFYRLIDPNWVLKAPETQCKALGFGPSLVDPDVPDRQEYCADPISCLATDDDGNCLGGFGYCTKEQNTWRFAGTECPAEYSGCELYTREIDRTQKAYINSSVDSCGSDDVGCLWYSRSRDNVGTVNSPRYVWNEVDRIYLNRSVETCPYEYAGCSEYISLATLGVNLLPNGDFNSFVANSATNFSNADWLNDSLEDTFSGWFGNPNVFTTSEHAYYGTIGLYSVEVPGDPTSLSTNVITGPVNDKTYTLSFWSKADVGLNATCSGEVTVGTATEPGTPVTINLTDDWFQYEFSTTFSAANSDTGALVTFRGYCVDSGGTSHGIYLDGIKFELNATSSGFSDYGQYGRVYLNSAASCTADDVGCDIFTPTAGGFDVPGKVTSNDLCPAECVGYQTYLELPNTFDLSEDPAAPNVSVNFIPSSGDECSASQVGCEEFTNVEEVEQGGEGIRYFTYIRQCVDDPFGDTYYTLEGNDTTGYQVRTWRLLESNLGTGLPCTHVVPGTSDCVDSNVSGDPNYIGNSGCTPADLNTDLNCREFFDINGNPHYVLQDRVIVSSNECIRLRRSQTGTVFFGLEASSRSCKPKDLLCSEYRGNLSNNVRTIFTDTFESGSVSPWISTSARPSSEATVTGGQSMTNENSSGSISQLIQRGNPANDVIAFRAGRDYQFSFWMKSDDPVQVTFLTHDGAPGPGGVDIWNTIDVPAGSGWQLYRTNKLYKDVDDSLIVRVRIRDGSGGTPAPQVFLDNIELFESSSRLYMIRNSWETPAVCDQPIQGAMLGCQEYTNSAGRVLNLRSFSKLCQDDVIGCQAFVDTQNSTDPYQEIFNAGDPSEIIVPADSLTYKVYDTDNTCFAEYKGCTEVGQPKFNREVDEDDPRYIQGYTGVAVLDDPDRYGGILCRADALFCEEYTTSDGASVYFKDPGNRTCTYRENVNVEGEIFSGWFRTDSLGQGIRAVGCSDDGELPFTASDFDLFKNTDFEYNRWAGICPAQYDQCTEFKDPLDTQGDNLFVNDDFGAGRQGWLPWGTPYRGNQTIDIDIRFETDPGRELAKLRTVDYGSMTIYQIFDNTDIDESDVFALSSDVNIQTLYPGINSPEVSIALNCQWDSRTDTDYCRLASGAVDLSGPDGIPGSGDEPLCEVDSDCPNFGTGNVACAKFSSTYCRDGAGNDTDVPCYNAVGAAAGNTFCQNILGDPLATCENPGGVGVPERDHVRSYKAYANTDIRGQWQTIRQVVDLGADGEGKQFVSCNAFGLIFHDGYARDGTSLNPRSGNPLGNAGVACNTTDQYDFSCFKTACSAPGVDGIPGTLDDTIGGECTLATSSETSAATNGICPVAGQTCGGNSEVWVKNPSFKVAKGYTYIDNSEIDADSCNGQVSQKDGCLLFLDVSERQIKLYNSFDTYDKSANSGGRLVSPVTCDPTNTTCSADTNRIIRVDRDRECSEWLACRSATEVFDPQTNSYRQICDQVGTCNEYVTGTDVLNCSNWVDPTPQRLEYGLYVNRSIDFDYADYSGYSIYDHYPVGTLDFVDVSVNSLGNGPDGRNADYRLVRVVDQCDSSVQYDQPCGPEDPLIPGDRLGVCFATDKCVVGIDGSRFSRESLAVVEPETRVWAESTSPFPYSVVENDTIDTREVKFGFQNANICESRNASCESSYYKFQYGGVGGGVTRYYSATTNLAGGGISNCICQGGLRDNQICETDPGADNILTTEELCPQNGSPTYLRRTEQFVNWPGFCLERDQRTVINGDSSENACLTWLPVDNSPTGFDFYNQNREAGYGEKIPAYYCLEVGLFEERGTFYLGENCSGSNCDAGMLPAELRGQYYVHTRDTSRSCDYIHDVEYCYAVPIGGNGIYSYDGSTYCGYQTERGSGQVYCESVPDASCQVLAQAVNELGENAALTNRFWEGLNNGNGFQIPDLLYTIDSNDRPFGSAIPAGIGFVTDLLFIRPPGEIGGAGSPYACSSNTASCALFDQSANIDGISVDGWKNPPFAGNEDYVDGINRLKSIYRKIFELYRYQSGDACAYTICGRPDEVADTGSGGYFGGRGCTPSDPNVCNQLGSGLCEPFSNRCANSVFNDSNSTSPLYRSCTACAVLGPFVTSQTSSKQCQSMFGDTNGDNIDDTGGIFSSDTACAGADLDPAAGIQLCASFSGAGGTPFSCQQIAGTTQYRCMSAPNEGNDCKIPENPDGTLVAAYLSCVANSQGLDTCHYLGEDTGIECSALSDCTASAANANGLAGALARFNQVAYCADNYNEGLHDYGAGDFCTGEPFTRGSTSIFRDITPVDCSPTATFTNLLGHTLTGGSICSNPGLCLPSHQVDDINNVLFCEKRPPGYLPLCDPDVQDCTGVDPLYIIDVGALPLDDSFEDDALLSPYIIPAECDVNGLNCTQAVQTQLVDVLSTNGSPVDDVGFSVNNKFRPGDNLLVGGKNYLVNLRFFMAANKNHMPIRYIDIDWGDDLRQQRVGYYKNYMEQCDVTQDIGPSGTGLLEYASAPEACREDFRSYLHVYAWSSRHLCDPLNPDHADAASVGGMNIASCYKPRVMVQDNWGFCTNGYFGLTGLGCKDPDPIKIIGGVPNGPGQTFIGGAQEPSAGDEAYVEFPGLIVVFRDDIP